MNELALFAGAGGGILGGILLGWNTVCAVERNAYAASVLASRQNDGILRPFPIWSDITTFDGREWKGFVDVVSGGFPCKGISATGRGEGLLHPESALWSHQARIIRDVEPRFALVENSPMLTRRGLGIVLGELAEMGFNARYGVLPAAAFGAPHERMRMWIVAAHPDRSQCQGGQLSSGENSKYADFGGCSWWQDKPRIHGVDDGMANRVDRLVAIGNGQVPIVVDGAWKALA